MYIMAISGGSKNGSNDAYAKEALIGVKEVCPECDIEFINLNLLDIRPCTGCIACVGSMMSGGLGDCIIKDDFKWLDEKILDADGLIFAMPVYEKAAPGIMNALQDRLCGPSHDTGTNVVAKQIAEKEGKPGPDPRKFKKKAVSFISIGGSDWTTKVSSDMNMVAMCAMWKVIDDEVFQWNKSALMYDEKLEKCHQIGINLVNACKDVDSAKYLGVPGVCPVCNSRNFYFDKGGKVFCEVCGVVGDMKCEDGKYTFEFEESQLEHAHITLPGKIKHMDDIYRWETQLMKDKKTDKYKERRKKYMDFISPSVPQK